MAHLYRRGTVWWLSADVEGQRIRRSLGTTDRSEAERLLKLQNASRAAPKTTEALEWYEAYSRTRRAHKTHQTALGYLRRALTDLGSKRVTDVSHAGIVGYLTKRAAAGAAPKTLNHIRSELRIFFGWLRDQGCVAVNPVERVRTFHVPAPQVSYLGAQDIEDLRGILQGTEIEGVALCMLWAGLRRSEALSPLRT